MTYHLITAAILLLALALYAAGFASGASILVVSAIVTEGVFWWRVLNAGHRT